MRTFRHTATASAEQMDVFGHLNNAAYLTIFEAARWAVLAEIGSAWNDLAEAGVAPVVLGVNVEFVKEVREGETVVVETEFEPTSPRRFIAHHRMVDADGKLRASATLQAGFFDMRARKLAEPGPALLEAIGIESAKLPPHPIVQGVGGAFLYAKNVDTLAAWYTARFGFALEVWGSSRGIELPSADRVPSRRRSTTTFALFQADFDLPDARTGRINFRVANLDALVSACREAGDRVEIGPDDFGRFAWVYDPEGNKVELWEPQRL